AGVVPDAPVPGFRGRRAPPARGAPAPGLSRGPPRPRDDALSRDLDRPEEEGRHHPSPVRALDPGPGRTAASPGNTPAIDALVTPPGGGENGPWTRSASCCDTSSPRSPTARRRH